jgi:hypothetical protein
MQKYIIQVAIMICLALLWANALKEKPQFETTDNTLIYTIKSD